MHILALAVDYDGTIAKNGSVSPETTAALRQLKESGRKILLVTGRELVDLQHACDDLDVFDCVVAENGAVLHNPASGQTRLIASPPPHALVERISTTRIPVSIGQSIIATWHPHEHVVMDAIHELGLEHQIIFNKDAVMVLPANVNKATGLRQALKELDISPLSVAGCGDAENDHSFLTICGCSAAVANALPALKAVVDIVLEGDHGEGIVELTKRIINEDDGMLPLHRRGIVAGTDRDGEPCYIRPENVVLIVGNSGCGKSSYMTLLSERMTAKHHEFCVIDPEGDYLSLADAAVIGGLDVAPSTEDALRLLLQADINVVVNTMSLSHDSRRRLFAELMPSIRSLRETSGRPQWLIIDEAHYALPLPDKAEGDAVLARSGAIIATVNPSIISAAVLEEVDTVITMGATAEQLLSETARLLGRQVPGSLRHLAPGEFLFWSLDTPNDASPAHILNQEQPEQAHNRHSGKYAQGDVGRERAFFFDGDGRYAHNLRDFLQIAADIDDQIWQAHLAAGDYSAWFRNVIRDDALADKAVAIENDPDQTAAQSREAIRMAVLERYIITL